VVVIAGLDFYMRWWSLSSGTTDNKVDVNLTVDKEQIREDAQKVPHKAQTPGASSQRHGYGGPRREQAIAAPTGGTDTKEREARQTHPHRWLVLTLGEIRGSFCPSTTYRKKESPLWVAKLTP